MSTDLYPARLLPYSNYIELSCEPFVEHGHIVRCLTKPAEFDPSGMLLESSFSFPQTSHWLTHFSVSLLGNYKLVDCAWQYALDKSSPRFNEFYQEWRAGKDGILPTDKEAIHPGPRNWGYFWIPLQKIHKQKFTVGPKTYECVVVHKPTMVNYWHFELHFIDEHGIDTCGLVNDGTLKRGQIKAIVTGIRAKLLSVCKDDDLQTDDWPKQQFQHKYHMLFELFSSAINWIYKIRILFKHTSKSPS